MNSLPTNIIKAEHFNGVYCEISAGAERIIFKSVASLSLAVVEILIQVDGQAIPRKEVMRPACRDIYKSLNPPSSNSHHAVVSRHEQLLGSLFLLRSSILLVVTEVFLTHSYLVKIDPLWNLNRKVSPVPKYLIRSPRYEFTKKKVNIDWDFSQRQEN